jgi:hypothetical protein
VAVRLGMARCLVGYVAQQYDDGVDCDNDSGRDTRRMDDTNVRFEMKKMAWYSRRINTRQYVF